MTFITNSLPADVHWGSFVTHSFLPHGQTNPKGRLRGDYITNCFSIIWYEHKTGESIPNTEWFTNIK